jgi:hypothetical protein
MPQGVDEGCNEGDGVMVYVEDEDIYRVGCDGWMGGRMDGCCVLITTVVTLKVLEQIMLMF